MSRGEPSSERYTPGHTGDALAMMAARTVETHGAFFLPHLRPGHSVLDVGCGPGTVTVGLAAAVAPGEVVGVDAAAEPLAYGRSHASRSGAANLIFRQGSAYELPCPDASADRVFSHALLEHLADPVAALREAHRVLRPGGMVGMCTPDWGSFVLAPPSAGLEAAATAYQDLQRANGGDPCCGRRLGVHLLAAGFADVRLDARFERFTGTAAIGGLLARLLEDADLGGHAEAVREWVGAPGAMFAEAWVSAVAVRP